MRILLLFLLFASFSTFAKEILLNNSKTYTVPENTVWVISGIKPAECNVCTADVYISGESSNVEINGVIIHGSFDFNFIEQNHAVIKIHAGTIINLGDSMPELRVLEQKN